MSVMIMLPILMEFVWLVQYAKEWLYEMNGLNISINEGECIFLKQCYLITGGICYKGCPSFTPYHPKARP